MSPKWNPADGTFHLGINMAGAVSAGAYTAGALDFLIQALDEWENAKQSPHNPIPRHHVSIDVFSGASAGGMCAAIAAVMVQNPFEHIDQPETKPVLPATNNKFYESWVNKIDIDSLLQTNDLQSGQPVVSLLDSTIIDQIADYALTPINAPQRPTYISNALTLFLTLTNVRGVPYSLKENSNAEGSAEEDIAYYADKLEFEVVPKFDSKTKSPLAVALPSDGQGLGWTLLKEAAKATGAFPIFLAPRKLIRHARDYYYRPWLSSSHTTHPCKFPPHWPLRDDDTIETLNVDGGVTNNNPFQLAHDFLASRNPLATHNGHENPREPNEANCAVLTIAPFTDDARYEEKFDSQRTSSIFRILPRLFSALISQSRFLGESLTLVVNSKTSSRFVLAPTRADKPGQEALQCGLLGAFGGFFDRSFRAHDYQLGRRNCQQFLRQHFRLAIDNPIMQAGLAALTPEEQSAVRAVFDPKQTGYLPIIPLCGGADVDLAKAVPGKIPAARLKQILKCSVRRLRQIAKPLIIEVFGHTPGSFAARIAANVLISTVLRSRLKVFLTNALHDVTTDELRPQ